MWIADIRAYMAAKNIELETSFLQDGHFNHSDFLILEYAFKFYWILLLFSEKWN